MAKSKSGGTRALLRGRVGSDVYSVGKDGMGKRQQVVRSLAEVVANPRTENQMFGRMIMSTVMQAVSALSPIIDHSFDGVAKGQPSISDFIRRNYALVKADALAHPDSDNTFGLNKYQEKGAKMGKYVISNGNVAAPLGMAYADDELAIALTAGTLTPAGFYDATGLSKGDFFTYVVLSNDGKAYYARVKVKESLADSATLDANSFEIEGNTAATIAISNNSIVLSLNVTISKSFYGVIRSTSVDGAWKHSACTLTGSDIPTWKADVALPTYPTGSEQYLNGGEI